MLLSGWLVALLVGVSEAPTWGWGSPKVIGLILLAVALCAVAWIVVELQSREPLIDMHMMRVPAVWTNNLVAFLFGIGMYSVIAFLPEFLQTPKSTGYGFGASIIQSGLYLLPLTVTMFIFGMLSGRIAAAIGSKAAVIIGSIFSLASLPDPGLRPHPALGDLPGQHPARRRSGPGLLGHVQPHRPGRAAGPDRGGQRHERQHPHHRGRRRGRGDVDHRDLDAAERRVSGGESGYTRGFAFLALMTVVAIVAAVFIPTATSEAADADHEPHLHERRAGHLVPGGTIAEG